MKKTILYIIFLLGIFAEVKADGVSSSFTVYKEFKPCTITLADGRKLSQPFANIFLKNSTLLYVSGGLTKQADVKAVTAVDFEDRHYIRIDTLLCFLVDTLGADALYKATIIDVPAYNRLLLNNHQLTNIDFSFNSVIQTSSIDLENESEIKMPLIDIFYYRFNGKMYRVHERELLRQLPKDKRRILKTFMNMSGFSWTDSDSLMKLLKALQMNQSSND